MTSPPLSLAAGLQTLLSRADLALGRLDGATQTLPDSDLFASMYVRKEAVLSCAMDGAQSSLDDVLAVEAQPVEAGASAGVNEVLTYVRALNRGLARVATQPISAALVRDLHRQLRPTAVGAGTQAAVPSWLGDGAADPLLASGSSFAPPPLEDLPPALLSWEAFVRADRPIPLLVMIGLAQVRLETVESFPEPDARLPRLVVALLLVERRLLRFPVLYLSQYFQRHRVQYRDLLQSVRDSGAWEPWMAFFLEGVTETAEDAMRTARRIVELRERHRAAVARALGRGAATGLRVLESLYSRPIITVADVAELTQTTFTGANQLVQRLVQLGVLAEATGNRRNRRFRYEEYVRLFSEVA